MEENIIKFVCQNPGCNKRLKATKRPDKKIIKGKCPSCGNPFEINTDELIPAPQAQAPQPAQTPKITTNPGIPGTIIGSGYKSGTMLEIPASAVLKIKGCFKDFAMEGYHEWIIGRDDDEVKSDINIPGDPSISRRSVKIEAIRDEKGPLYRLSVINAKNTVYVNDRPLGTGESVAIVFGTRIKMGRTQMEFIKK